MPSVPAPTAFEQAAMMSCDSAMEPLVRYANEISDLDGDELDKFQKRARDRFVGAPLFVNRMRLALLLLHPNAEPGQAGGTIELLEDALAMDDDATRNEKAFARFLYAFVAKRVERENSELESGRRSNARLRSRESQLLEQRQEAQEALAEERRQRQNLERQLEALKQLEETINQRDGRGKEGSR